MLIIETPFEYDAIMLALRIGADGMRELAGKIQVPDALKNNDAAACVDFARTLLDNPEVTR
ncbi:MAG: hypothetical protein A2W25_01430 [candidate division Zixibacteria bacterium RBG_16_53_22]|nr:MAG: hypothetical protein A2W25_01430 [candidate division Zixibacteria bacterium RBG_16_53_22]